MDTLIQLLITCATLLRSVKENFWADKIEVILSKSKDNVDFYLLEDILSWYGGMGSFNDLMLSEYNEHSIKKGDEDKLNKQLNQLRSQIYQEVVHLKQSINGS